MNRLEHLLSEGAGFSELCDELGFSRETLARRMTSLRLAHGVTSTTALIGALAGARRRPVPPIVSAAVIESARLTIEGLSTRQVADARGLTVKTVYNQLVKAFRLLDVSTRYELAATYELPPARSVRSTTALGRHPCATCGESTWRKFCSRACYETSRRAPCYACVACGVACSTRRKFCTRACWPVRGRQRAYPRVPFYRGLSA